MLLIKYFRNPPGVECDKEVEVYGASLAQMASAELYHFDSLKEHYTPHLNDRVSRQGALACFCKNQVENLGEPRDKMYQIYNVNGEFGDFPLCESYYQYIAPYGIMYFVATGFGQVIAMTNFFIRFVWMYMASWIGFTTVTEEIEFIKNSVFYLYFLNSGLLYVLAPWDSREVDIPIINKLFQGVYTDYNANWF